ncbi:MAG: DUF6017 domain-containing protein [Anaerovoracaceae bacterium]
MISRRIVECARFLKMPLTSQNLYFHLVVNADDDGVVEAYSVLNLCRAEESDLHTLKERGFVDILNEDLVTYIESWRSQNVLRADRKCDSLYLDLLQEARPDVEILTKKVRADRAGREKSDNRGAQSAGKRDCSDSVPQEPDAGRQWDGPADDMADGPGSFFRDVPGAAEGRPKGSQSNQNQSKISQFKKNQIRSDQVRALPEAAGTRMMRERIAGNICLEELRSYAKSMGPEAETLLQKIYGIVCAMVCVPRRTVSISRREYPWEEVRDAFLKLSYEHVESVLDRLMNGRSDIQNFNAYVITALFYELGQRVTAAES